MIDIATKFVLIAIPYLVSTFVWTALYVRWGKNEKLTLCARKHFYLFPVIPVGVAAIWAITALGIMGTNVRRLFEVLAGKRTYHRRHIGYYRLANVRIFPRSSVKTKRSTGSVRGRAVVNDNQTVRRQSPNVRFRL